MNTLPEMERKKQEELQLSGMGAGQASFAVSNRYTNASFLPSLCLSLIKLAFLMSLKIVHSVLILFLCYFFYPH